MRNAVSVLLGLALGVLGAVGVDRALVRADGDGSLALAAASCVCEKVAM